MWWAVFGSGGSARRWKMLGARVLFDLYEANSGPPKRLDPTISTPALSLIRNGHVVRLSLFS